MRSNRRNIHYQWENWESNLPMTTPKGFIPIQSYEDISLGFTSCFSSELGTSKIIPLRKLGTAKYDKDYLVERTIGVTKMTSRFADYNGFVATMQQLRPIQCTCYKCHAFVGNMEKQNKFIGLCMGECANQ